MRGKEDVENMTGGFRGITPAYAGKSTRWAASRQPSGDHPRVCGEKLATMQ